MVPKPTCLNLRKLYGQKYKIRHEESYAAEKQDFRTEEEPWLQIIPCQHGHVFPHGGQQLAWSSRTTGSIASKVLALPFVIPHQQGDDGVTVLFDAQHLEEIAAIVKPKLKPPKRVMTPEQKQKAVERIAKYKFLPQKKTVSEEPECVASPQLDSQSLPRT